MSAHAYTKNLLFLMENIFFLVAVGGKYQDIGGRPKKQFRFFFEDKLASFGIDWKVIEKGHQFFLNWYLTV